jgi:hypothetical protein
MHLANLLCPELNSDDYDELEDCCRGCTFWGTIKTNLKNILKLYEDINYLFGWYIMHHPDSGIMVRS